MDEQYENTSRETLVALVDMYKKISDKNHKEIMLLNEQIGKAWSRADYLERMLACSNKIAYDYREHIQAMAEMI
jgi:hypothetical protein